MFKCKNCLRLQEENRYLRTLIDRFLEKMNMQPVEIDNRLGKQVEKELEAHEILTPNLESYGDV